MRFRIFNIKGIGILELILGTALGIIVIAVSISVVISTFEFTSVIETNQLATHQPRMAESHLRQYIDMSSFMKVTDDPEQGEGGNKLELYNIKNELIGTYDGSAEDLTYVDALDPNKNRTFLNLGTVIFREINPLTDQTSNMVRISFTGSNALSVEESSGIPIKGSWAKLLRYGSYTIQNDFMPMLPGQSPNPYSNGFPSGVQTFTAYDGVPDGYIVQGRSGSGNGMGIAYIKLDTEANVSWMKRIQSTNWPAAAFRIRQSFANNIDGASTGYVITGFNEDPLTTTHQRDIILIKTDNDGDIDWFKQYGAHCWEEAYDVKQVFDKTSHDDDGYVLTGYTYSIGCIPRNCFIMKTETNGDFYRTETGEGSYITAGDGVVFGNQYGQQNAYYPQGLCARSVARIIDGWGDPDGYIISGIISSQGTLNKMNDALIIKVDNNLDLEWAKAFGGPELDSGYMGETGFAVIQTTDMGFLMVGSTSSVPNDMGGYFDVYIIKVDKYGTHKWSRAFGGQWSDIAFDAIEETDGTEDIVILGQTNIAAETDGEMSTATFLLKLNKDGDYKWCRIFDGAIKSDTIAGYSLCQDFNESGEPDGYFIMGDLRVYSSKTWPWETLEGLILIKTNKDGFCPQAENLGYANFSAEIVDIEEPFLRIESVPIYDIPQIRKSDEQKVREFWGGKLRKGDIELWVEGVPYVYTDRLKYIIAEAPPLVEDVDGNGYIEDDEIDWITLETLCPAGGCGCNYDFEKHLPIIANAVWIDEDTPQGDDDWLWCWQHWSGYSPNNSTGIFIDDQRPWPSPEEPQNQPWATTCTLAETNPDLRGHKIYHHEPGYPCMVEYDITPDSFDGGEGAVYYDWNPHSTDDDLRPGDTIVTDTSAITQTQELLE